MKVALYCRVDRGGNECDQKEAIFIQRKKLEHHAKRNHFQIVGCYEDFGFPGNILERPSLKKMLDEFAKGEFEAVFVVKRNCLFRGEQAREPKWPFQVYSLYQREHQRER